MRPRRRLRNKSMCDSLTVPYGRLRRREEERRLREGGDEAYSVLSDPTARRRYNELLSQGYVDYDQTLWLELKREENERKLADIFR